MRLVVRDRAVIQLGQWKRILDLELHTAARHHLALTRVAAHGLGRHVGEAAWLGSGIEEHLRDLLLHWGGGWCGPHGSGVKHGACLGLEVLGHGTLKLKHGIGGLLQLEDLGLGLWLLGG